MACIEVNTHIGTIDDEREEGEIVDDLDDLSDISSEEEFLLRQRLQVLENYNNVLERKARRSSIGAGYSSRKENEVLCDLSDISATELDQVCSKNFKEKKRKSKRRKEDNCFSSSKNKDYRKKPHRKKKLAAKIVNESSDESEDEYKDKRRKLANAVSVSKISSDKTTLSARLKKMLDPSSDEIKDSEEISNDLHAKDMKTDIVDSHVNIDSNLSENCKTEFENIVSNYECVDLCTDDDVQILTEVINPNVDTVDGVSNKNSKESHKSGKDSDEDLEALRQVALNTKAVKKTTATESQVSNVPIIKDKQIAASEDDDSDTAELRFICLKSAFLKKAIEMKQKQKLRKRLSQSANMNDFILDDGHDILKKVDSANNTDIESVDMDIGSDGEEKSKDTLRDVGPINVKQNTAIHTSTNKNENDHPKSKPREEELDEDEDVLRAKLLTSLSKNLPNLVNAKLVNQLDNAKIEDKTKSKSTTVKIPEEKRFIINLGESDSEGEHEATKNLTKMHMKLSEQVDFQSKLDMFLKSTRMEVENQKLPDVVQQPLDKKEKFVAKAVNHLPKSEQIEYKNLVKRMVELEKLKQARQASISSSQTNLPKKETLKPCNVSKNIAASPINQEEQIALSRKKIAEESSHVLKLKEEATKLSQKYKIVQTELRNITTAITLNKKEQRAAQIRLSKIRAHHQTLITSSNKHSIINGMSLKPNKVIHNKLQKENNPKEEYNNSQLLKSFKVSVVNDFKEDVASKKLSVQVDVSNNMKIVKFPQNIEQNTNNTNNEYANKSREDKSKDMYDNHNNVIKECDIKKNYENVRNNSVTGIGGDNFEYRSPLDALTTVNWNEDPNAVLCPFEVAGNCKDPDCKFLHPKPKQ